MTCRPVRTSMRREDSGTSVHRLNGQPPDSGFPAVPEEWFPVHVVIHAAASVQPLAVRSCAVGKSRAVGLPVTAQWQDQTADPTVPMPHVRPTDADEKTLENEYSGD